MVSTLLSLLAWAAAQPATTIGSIQGLEPSAAGERVLRGRQHGPVERIEPDIGLDPPGLVRLWLTERPVGIEGGCVRKKWNATFQHVPGDDKGTAVFSDAYAVDEVSLKRSAGCQDGVFAHVNPGTSIEDALSALRHLEGVRSGRGRVRLSCADSTGSGLCSTPRTIRQELARLPAWAVTKQDGVVRVWLGQRGQAVTELSYNAADIGQVRVERRISAPF